MQIGVYPSSKAQPRTRAVVRSVKQVGSDNSSNGSGIGTSIIQLGAGTGAVILGVALFKVDIEEGFWGNIGKTIRFLLFPIGAAVGLGGIASLVGFAPKETRGEDTEEASGSAAGTLEAPSIGTTPSTPATNANPSIQDLLNKLKKLINNGWFTNRDKLINEINNYPNLDSLISSNKDSLIKFINLHHDPASIIDNLVDTTVAPQLRELGLDALYEIALVVRSDEINDLVKKLETCKKTETEKNLRKKMKLLIKALQTGYYSELDL